MVLMYYDNSASAAATAKLQYYTLEFQIEMKSQIYTVSVLPPSLAMAVAVFLFFSQFFCLPFIYIIDMMSHF